MDTTDIQDYKWHNFTGDSCTNAGGWASSVLRTALQEKGWLYQKFSSTFTSAISKTKKSSQKGGSQGTSCSETEDSFFILSAGELTASNNSYGPNYKLEGNQYTFWSEKGVTDSNYSRLGMKTRAGNYLLCFAYDGNKFTSSATWWQRSAYITRAYDFLDVIVNDNYFGTPSGAGSSSAAYGVVPAFSF